MCEYLRLPSPVQEPARATPACAARAWDTCDLAQLRSQPVEATTNTRAVETVKEARGGERGGTFEDV